MNHVIRSAKNCLRVLSAFILLFITTQSFAQKPADWELDKMPVKLETDFAISSLPPYLQSNATVYLLDPKKGYYVARKGSNGFICFVTRTEWEWGEFRNDIFTAISYDAEGARAIFPIYQEVAAMRASGKFTALQIKSIITGKIKKGVYKAPARQGVSFMLAPIMRSYNGPTSDYKKVITMNMPHYMVYAPYVTSPDIGNTPEVSEDGPFVANAAAPIFGPKKSPFGYIIFPAGQAEKAKIMKDTQDLLKGLIAYKSYLNPMSMKH